MSEVKANKISPATSTVVTLGDSSDTFVVTTGAKIDINGTELILDADADTSITADTDDQIDIRIAGADDFQFTANTFTAQSGSTIAAQAITATTITATGVVTIPDGSVSAPAISNSGDANTGVYFPAADTVGVTAGGTEQFRFGSNPIPGGGNKNLLINGAMNVWQRSTAANTGIGASSGVYVLDRWNHYIDSGPQARVTTTQVASGGDAAAAGFTSAMKVDCTTAEAAVAAGELHGIAQRIEARHVQHLAWGTATAKTLTLSFWMKSPKSGIHCCSLSDVGGRTRATEFTISSADTWENFSVNFAGDTSGAVFTDVSTSGLMVFFPLVAGSNFHDTADTWYATQKHTTSNQQNLLDSTSNDFYLTGVQLEVGSVATDFAHEDYTLTLSKCRRYCFGMTAAASADIALGMGTSTQRAYMFLHVPVEMRGNPALTATAADWDIMDLVNADVAVETLIIHTHYGGTMIYKLRVDQSGGGITTYRPYSLKEGPHAGGKILFLDAEL